MVQRLRYALHPCVCRSLTLGSPWPSVAHHVSTAAHNDKKCASAGTRTVYMKDSFTLLARSSTLVIIPASSPFARFSRPTCASCSLNSAVTPRPLFSDSIHTSRRLVSASSRTFGLRCDTCMPRRHLCESILPLHLSRLEIHAQTVLDYVCACPVLTPRQAAHAKPNACARDSPVHVRRGARLVRLPSSPREGQAHL